MSLFTNLYHWIDRKLNRKYILGMASGLVAISILFALLFLSMYQKQLTNERANTSLHLNRLLQTALEYSMIKRDLDGVREIITRFGQQDEIQNVMIINPQGEIRLATEKRLEGTIDLELGHTTHDHTVFIESKRHGEALRSINPIHNRNECGYCHGSKEKNPVNGILVVDFDANVLRKNARDTTIALMGAGSTVVLITLFGGWWFMGQFVLKPVRKLLTAQDAFARGDLKTRVATQGNDEIAKLGLSFNGMSETIEEQWQTLEQKKKYLQSLIDGIPDGIRVLDQDYNIVLANQAYIEQTGGTKEQVLSVKCYTSHQRTEPCIPTLETCPLYEIKKHNKPVKAVHHHFDLDGNEQAFEIFAAPVTEDKTNPKNALIVEVVRDLSQSVDYSQEQRLTSLGMLASGVAHEIHNPLASIQIAFQTINQLVESEEPLIEQLKVYIALIEGEIDKCVDITGRLLKLGSLPDIQLQPISINTVVKETLSILHWEADSRGITMTMDLPKTSPRVLGTDNELRMMVLNLVQNAYHAMPEGGELNVNVKTNNQQVMISIKDTGVGIPTEMQARIFDPFFSHRSDDEKGTGLGLSITQAIVKSFKGTIEVTSTEGKETCFTITLPDADHQSGESGEIA